MWRRRGAVLAALCVALCAGAVSARAADPPAATVLLAARDLVMPLQTLNGARFVAAAEPGGLLRPHGSQAFVRFTFPTAVAARGPDVYVLDSGNGALYRLDAAEQTMTRIGNLPVFPGTRLVAAADHSLYVINPGSAQVRRFSRDGRLLASYADAANLVRPIELAVDPVSGLVWVADGSYRQLVAFHAAGRTSYIVPLESEDGELAPSAAPIALMRPGSGTLWFADPGCHCIAEIGPDGRLRGRFGKDDLVRPSSLTSDRHGRLWVVDAFDRGVKVFASGRLVARFGAADLGARSVEGIALDEDVLYVADGLGARVVMLRLLPPRQTGPK